MNAYLWALLSRAEEAGDTQLVGTVERALRGDDAAIDECERILGMDDTIPGDEDEDDERAGLHPVLTIAGWCVKDPEGGTWWPDDASVGPTTALLRCRHNPTRGRWSS